MACLADYLLVLGPYRYVYLELSTNLHVVGPSEKPLFSSVRKAVRPSRRQAVYRKYYSQAQVNDM